ncbi:MAG: kinase 2 [Patescibacteria group bacterium]|nr:kinase 2 [Patescibacteria group bacterium]
MPPFQQQPQTPVSSSPSHEEDYEKVVDDLIKFLPSELQERWRSSYYDAEHPEHVVSELRQFIEKRKKVALDAVELSPDLPEELREEVVRVVDSIRQGFGNTSYFLGNGATAEVYILPLAPHICTKYITSQEKYNEGNHIRKEFEILSELRQITVGNVRVPKPVFVRVHPSEGHSYGMERVNGESLSVILEKPSNHQELIAVAKSVDRENVIQSVLGFVKEMHKKKIIHGDLFQRNVMIDREGNFFVIDFGKASHEEIGEDKEDAMRRDISTVENELRLFFKGIDNISI